MFYTLSTSPHQIADIRGGYKNLYLQLISGTGVRISSLLQSLQYQGGLQLASTDGILWLEWKGPLWVVGDGILIVEVI